MKPMSAPPLLRLRGVGKTYTLGGGPWARLLRRQVALAAVADVSLEIGKGEVLGLVGESGSGKSTLGRIVARLINASSGEIAYQGQDVTGLSGAALLPYRRKVQLVFQDTQSSLNPRKRVSRALQEALAARGVVASERAEEARALLGMVGLAPGVLARYPHELSGGQRQRVCIARGLAMRPELLVADEPVSALDVSLQGQVINLLMRLHEDLGLTMLFISHDLAVVRRICTRIAVMYAGRIVEVGPSDQLMRAPAHPYTQALIEAVPKGLAGRGHRHRFARPASVAGRMPSQGCPFQPRCPQATPVCAEVVPLSVAVTSDHYAACVLARPASPSADPDVIPAEMEEILDVPANDAAEQHARR